MKLIFKTFRALGVITLSGVLFAARPGLAEAKTSYRYTGDLSLDLRRVPFSRFGSYMTFSMLTDMGPEHPLSGLYAPNGIPGLYLRNLHGGTGVSNLVHPVFHIELLKSGSSESFNVKATSTLLRLTASGGEAEIYFDAVDRIRFRTHGVSLRLAPVGDEVTVPKADSHWEMFGQDWSEEKYTVWPQVGKLEMSGSWNGTETENPAAVFTPDPASHIAEGEIDTYDSVWTPPANGSSFESGLSSVREEYQRWLTRMPEVSPEFGPGAELAAYVGWSAVVASKDFLDKPTMLMSKNWMAIDSGWDNSTVFLKGVPVESPDLSGFLVLQMDTLATMAEKLGKKDEATEWHRRSDTLLKQMLARFWKDDHFVAIRTQDDSVVESESLLLYIPVILGDKLPPDVQRKLVEGLTRQGRFRTPHGFATEALNSPIYTPDGYWRGPIWAPSSMLIADGLDSMGQKQLAHDLRMDFCNMAQKSGMAENFDAQTAAALRDPAYTWTSSVYLLFAHKLWQESPQ